MERKIYSIKLGPAKCAVDLGDGSERGEYVNQDYILNKLGRPHRAITLMYCYYPHDEGFPVRARDAFPNRKIAFQWDYPYDDYFTYKGGIGGTTSDEPFTCMRDVRRHGQDVILTLTIDPLLPDEYLVQIAHDLSTFGRMRLRINHEATGDWFSFTKRASYKEIGDFYVRFHNILKREAPNVSTILCIGGIESLEHTQEIVMEKEFADAVRAADIWSVDKYLALHWGWPFDIADKDTNQYKRVPSGTLSLLVNTKSSLLKGFTEDFHTTPPWYNIVKHSFAANLNGESIVPDVWVIDNPQRGARLALLYRKKDKVICTSRLWEISSDIFARHFAAGLVKGMLG